MSYRYMRILVLFDLPMVSSADIREYQKFRKFLLKSGFFMMQESVYCKLALNATISEGVLENIRKNKPADGLVQVLTLTEKQFSKMEIIVGEQKSNVLATDERLVIL